MSQIEDPSVAALLVAKAAAARERGVTLSLDLRSELADGVGDDVVTILGNLVDNAVDAAGPGGTVEVLALAHSADSGVEIQVSDDGPGVPAHLRAEIFSPGITTKLPTADHHGRGIGLALVSRIVARRGGHAEVADRPGGGAAFSVVLPAASRHTSASGPVR